MGITTLALLTALFAPGQPPGTDAVPPRVLRYAERVWTRLIDTLDVEALLRPSCKELVASIRGGSGNSPIDSDLLPTLTDREVCNAVIEVNTIAFQGSIATMSRFVVDDKAMTEERTRAVAQELLDGFFPGQHLRVVGDEHTGWVEDATGWRLPDELASREDITRFHRLMKGFRSLKAQGVNWKTPMLDANADYIARYFPGDRALKPWDTGQYHQCRYGWCIIIDGTGREPKVRAFMRHGDD